jgi:hypothetical protein
MDSASRNPFCHHPRLSDRFNPGNPVFEAGDRTSAGTESDILKLQLRFSHVQSIHLINRKGITKV